MTRPVKQAFLETLANEYGAFRKLGNSQSLYELSDSRVRLYLRYSKVHDRNQTFYGLRHDDLRQLEGHPSAICFLWDDQVEPLIVPFSNYEDVFSTLRPASDGQYKAQVYLDEGGLELYLAKAGRFNVEGNVGWKELDNLARRDGTRAPMNLSHGQVQTLLGAIGAKKGYDVWIPPPDQSKLDWSLAHRFACKPVAPQGYQSVSHIIQQIDVIWFSRGSNDLKAAFEVEHSTTIYSGLLRFNDFRIAAPQVQATFAIVANDVRRNLFLKQLNRPTFCANGLDRVCTFLDYINVFDWYSRLQKPHVIGEL